MPTGLLKRQGMRLNAQSRPSHVLQQAPSAPPVQVMPVAPPAVLAAPVSAPPVSAAEIDRLQELARAEGLALGRTQGQQEADQAYRDQLAVLEALIKSVHAAWLEERDRMVAGLADFAFVATNRLLGDCLQDPTVALAAVQSVLNECDGWRDLTLEVNPLDAAYFSSALANDAALAEKGLKVLACAAVAVGGCRVISGQGSLDARLEFQLAELRTRLDAQRFTWSPSA